jgi:hypothetical protein
MLSFQMGEESAWNALLVCELLEGINFLFVNYWKECTSYLLFGNC